MNFKPKIVVIVGPTSSGKSDLAVMLAKKFGGEVISADSRQVYRGMNIGTGKITAEEMRGIPHHLLDVASPKKVYTVARYKHDAQNALKTILGRKKLPIICGGTGFYVSALVDDLMLPDVKPDLPFRKRLEKKTALELFALLKKLDPKRAKTIDAKNPRRLIRAIEIAYTLGKVPAISKHSLYDTLFIGIVVPKKILKTRISKRLFKRVKNGMSDEVAALHQSGVSWKRMEDLGLEYRYCSRYLRKIIDKKTLLFRLETAIWKYAKRQMTWFKRNKNIHWVALDDINGAEKLMRSFLGNRALSEACPRHRSDVEKAHSKHPEEPRKKTRYSFVAGKTGPSFVGTNSGGSTKR